MSPLLFDAFAASLPGHERQALIFHIALTAPPETGFPRLWRIVENGEPEDAEDALCALAFAGDPDALYRFEELAATPSAAEVRREWGGYWGLHQLHESGGRDVLRSYRSIEVLDRAPYFHVHSDHWGDVEHALEDRRFPWAREPDATAEVTLRLLNAWLRRYPRPPGQRRHGVPDRTDTPGDRSHGGRAALGIARRDLPRPGHAEARRPPAGHAVRDGTGRRSRDRARDRSRSPPAQSRAPALSPHPPLCAGHRLRSGVEGAGRPGGARATPDPLPGAPRALGRPRTACAGERTVTAAGGRSAPAPRRTGAGRPPPGPSP